MREFLVMLAHGSSNSSWSDAFFDMTAPLRAKYNNSEIAFMELSDPSLAHVCENAKRLGFTSVKVLPLFLATGRHLKVDVPRMIEEIQANTGLSIQLLPPIGESPQIAQAISLIAEEHLSTHQTQT